MKTITSNSTKIFLSLLLVVLNASALRAQSGSTSQREMLTKDETINYINKKLGEAVGLKCQGPTVVKNFIELKGERVVYHRQKKYTDGSDDWKFEMSFNPALIKEFRVTNVFRVQLPLNSIRGIYGNPNSDRGKWDTWNSDGSSGASIHINFCVDASDPSNFDKLKKAFEHLRDLAKAEDDPFGN